MSLKGPDVDRWRESREGLRWESDADLLRKDSDLRAILSLPPLDGVASARKQEQWAVVRQAVTSQVVDVDGVLTPAGVRELMRWSDDKNLL